MDVEATLGPVHYMGNLTKTIMGEWKPKGYGTAALTLVHAVAIKEISLNTMRKKLEKKTEDS